MTATVSPTSIILVKSYWDSPEYFHMYSRLNSVVNTLVTRLFYAPETRINKNRSETQMSQKRSLDYWARQLQNQPSSHPQYNPPSVNHWTSVTLALCPHFLSFSFICNPDTRALIFTQIPLSLFFLWPSSVLPPGCVPSHIGQDAVDEQGHDGGAEQAGHGHRDEPRQEDVPEEAPVHSFLRADPTHGHNRTHLQATAGRGGKKNNQKQQRSKALKWQSQRQWRAAGCSGFSLWWGVLESNHHSVVLPGTTWYYQVVPACLLAYFLNTVYAESLFVHFTLMDFTADTNISSKFC